jgi:16S rRNA (adenine1518-N6/adenine1519-N6)-dimethyltransferase
MQRKQIEEILAAAGTRPTRRLGQHFMMDQRVLDQIIAAAALSPEDIVLEVGPGPGNLTSRLSPLVSAVLAVDLDAPLLAAASSYWAGLSNVRWITADALEGKHCLNPVVIDALRSLRPTTAWTGSAKLVSNLPYNVASPLIIDILAAQCVVASNNIAAPPMNFERLVFTVQWEVGQRMRAAAGTGHYGSISVLIALMADVEVLANIAPGAFWPPPKVRSALVRIVPSMEKLSRIHNVRTLQSTVSNLFSHRRQNISNAIRHSFDSHAAAEVLDKLRAIGFDPGRRSETLAPEEFLQLSQCWPS